jgi:hypothetical protein
MIPDDDFLYQAADEKPSIRRAYARSVASFQSWQRTSAHLFHAATRIEAEVLSSWNAYFAPKPYKSFEQRREDVMGMQLHDTYLMLVGYALENLLKAAIVKSDTRKIFDQTIARGVLPKELNQHKLHELSLLAKVRLSSEQRETIERVSVNVVWAGRYPVPTKAEVEQPVPQTYPFATSYSRAFSLQDIQIIKDIAEHISECTGIKNPIEGPYP